MTKNTNTIAFKAGRKAAEQGKELEKAIAPYTAGTQRHADYKAGFESYENRGNC